MSYQEADVHGAAEHVVKLPEDPEDGQVFEASNGEYVGGSIVLSVFRGKDLLGAAQRIETIPTMSRKYLLTRLNSCRLLKKGDLLHIRAVHNSYSALVFRDGYGWQGCKGSKSKEKVDVIQSGYYRVEASLTVGPYNDSFHLYEYICIEKIKEKK